MAQGNPLSEAQVQRVCTLLRDSELSLPAIAERLDLSRSIVVMINRRFNIRQYNGSRSVWTMKGA